MMCVRPLGTMTGAQSHILQHIPKLPLEEDNFFLIKPTTEQELHQTVMTMQKDKILGPDGIPIEFWGIIKQDLMAATEQLSK